MSGASKQRQLLHQVHLLHQAVGEFSGLDIGIAGGGDMTMGGVGGTGNLEHIYIYICICCLLIVDVVFWVFSEILDIYQKMFEIFEYIWDILNSAR